MAGDDRKDVGGPMRGFLIRSAVRQLVTVAVLVLAYYLLPLDRGSDLRTAAVLVVGLLAVVGLVVWQLRAILNAAHPLVQAAHALAAAVPFYLLLFATTYYLMSVNRPTDFSEALGRTDALYFTVTVFATVGFGDITPLSEAARAVVLVQMVANLVVLGLLVRVLTGAVRINRGRRTQGGPTGL